MKLSRNFNLPELTYSATANKYSIDNSPGNDVIVNLLALTLAVLQPLRRHFKVPIIIGSGYRCPQVNMLVGGVPHSQHMTGEAADIHIPGYETGRQWFEWIRDNLDFDQLIWERQSKSSSHYWIHVSYKRDASLNRRQVVNYLEKEP